MILKLFIEYSNYMDDIYQNSREWNLNKKRKLLITYIIWFAYMLSNKKLQQIVTWLFLEADK